MIQYNYNITVKDNEGNETEFNTRDSSEIVEFVIYFCDHHKIYNKFTLHTLKNLLSYSKKYDKCRYTKPHYITNLKKTLLKEHYKDVYNESYDDIDTVDAKTHTTRINKIYMKDKTSQNIFNQF